MQSLKEQTLCCLCCPISSTWCVEAWLPCGRHLFKLEQDMYEREGIDWAHVEFEDNQACVDLLDMRPPKGTGLLSLLDEECLFPKARSRPGTVCIP